MKDRDGRVLAKKDMPLRFFFKGEYENRHLVRWGFTHMMDGTMLVHPRTVRRVKIMLATEKRLCGMEGAFGIDQDSLPVFTPDGDEKALSLIETDVKLVQVIEAVDLEESNLDPILKQDFRIGIASGF